VNRSRLAPALALCAAAATTMVSAALAGGSAQAATTAVESSSPIRLTSPTEVTAYTYRGWVDFDPRLRLVAGAEPFEIWSRKKSFSTPITSEWRSSAGTVTLPDGLVTDFRGLTSFVHMRIRNADGELVRSLKRDVCLNGDGTRARPDAPLRSPYPYGCSYSRLTRGYVQGIQAGWANYVYTYGKPFRLQPGEYDVTAYIPKAYREPLQIAAADGIRKFHLHVTDEGFECRGCRTDGGQPRTEGGTGLQPAASEPATASAGEPVGPMPDLQSLPAFGLRIAPSGNFLQFSADVWNAGTSPLVVDGFRREGEDVMDAYQYFVDADGNQTGYQQVGTMEWDAKDSHQHWHFRDFARYRLLKADKTNAVRSRKEAFCLANTDPIDYTVPGADWRPENTDLHTACGDQDALSVREVLSSGSGDTYAQFRAGQSFDLRGLPNGQYYIAVEANPVGRLVELDTTNNVAYRKVTIGGVEGARTAQVGWH